MGPERPFEPEFVWSTGRLPAVEDTLPETKGQVRTCKWMVGIFVSFWVSAYFQVRFF